MCRVKDERPPFRTLSASIGERFVTLEAEWPHPSDSPSLFQGAISGRVAQHNVKTATAEFDARRFADVRRLVFVVVFKR